VNKYRFPIPENDGYINIPIEIKWDFLGKDDSIEIYEESVIEDIIGTPRDFEILRFSHQPHTDNTRTDINYEFNFFDNTQGTGTDISLATASDWATTYLNEGFTPNQIIPVFKLDYVGDKEGFFMYWIRKKETIDIKTFYMSAKFFNARVGGFMRMMTVPQTTLPNKFLFDTSVFFYYRVELDYTNYTYSIFNSTNNRVGTTSTIKWYEYVNQ